MPNVVYRGEHPHGTMIAVKRMECKAIYKSDN